MSRKPPPPDPNRRAVRDAIEGAEPPGGGHDVPGFTMTGQGLFKEVYDQGGKARAPLHVSGPFEVLAQTRDADNEGWGLLLRWKDGDGSRHEWIMPQAVLVGDGKELRARLSSGGLYLSPSQGARNALVEYLAQQQPKQRVRTVPHVGWSIAADDAPVFILPAETIGKRKRERVRLELPGPPPAIYKAAGSLAGWQQGVAARCVGNPILTFAAACGFAGPLLTPMAEMGGGIHLYGPSRRGKSTALYVAASVWGAPRGHHPFARSWRATGNALEATAAEHNDTLLPLDEIGQVEPRELGEIAYMLANGSGKTRAQREGRAKPALTWRLLLLSTGEKRMSDVIAEAGQRVVAGQEVRLVDLAADGGAGLGAFTVLHGAATPAALAEQLDQAMRAEHGTAGPAFLESLVKRLAADPDWPADALRPRVLDFLGDFLPAGADSQVRTVGRRFAIVAIGGELATEAGLTGWPEGAAWKAAGWCFRAWMDTRGGTGSREDMEAVTRLRACLAADGQARFELWRDRDEQDGHVPTESEPPPEGRQVMKRLGWRRWTRAHDAPGGRSWRFYFTTDGFREVMAGLDVGAAARALAQQGYLRAGGRGTSRTAKPPGFPSGVAVYEVLGTILAGASQGSDGDSDD